METRNVAGGAVVDGNNVYSLTHFTELGSHGVFFFSLIQRNVASQGIVRDTVWSSLPEKP